MQDEQTGIPTKSNPAKRLAAKLVLVVVSLLFGLLLVEVALRVMGYSYPDFYIPDAERGYALEPGMAGWYRKEGEAYVRINGDGLRDREHAREKPPGVVRVAVVGDSYAEAFQVPQEKAFWSVMEGRLQNCEAFGGKKVEVINFGVSGYGTAQELITLRRRVWAYSPDIVLLAFTTNNDISDNSRAFKKIDIPYFVYRDGRLTLDDSFRSSKAFRRRNSIPGRLGRWLGNSLRVVQLLSHSHAAFKTYLKSRKTQSASEQSEPLRPARASSGAPAARFVRARVEASPPASKPDAVAQAEELGVDNMIYRAPDGDPVWGDAWNVTEGLLALMRDEVRGHGAKFLVVTLSNGIQVYPDASARQAFMRRVGSDDIFYPDRRIEALGEREGFAVVSLAPALQAYADEHKAFLHGFGRELGNGHWNLLGHALAGELLAAKLCEEAAK